MDVLLGRSRKEVIPGASAKDVVDLCRVLHASPRQFFRWRMATCKGWSILMGRMDDAASLARPPGPFPLLRRLRGRDGDPPGADRPTAAVAPVPIAPIVLAEMAIIVPTGLIPLLSPVLCSCPGVTTGYHRRRRRIMAKTGRVSVPIESNRRRKPNESWTSSAWTTATPSGPSPRRWCCERACRSTAVPNEASPRAIRDVREKGAAPRGAQGHREATREAGDVT